MSSFFDLETARVVENSPFDLRNEKGHPSQGSPRHLLARVPGALEGLSWVLAGVEAHRHPFSLPVCTDGLLAFAQLFERN